ncbi:MAG: hypothetical protein AAGF88_04820 [Pseudomonadota bacterium]
MIRPQYHFRQGRTGLKAWNVAHLIHLSTALPVIEVPLAEIAELDETYWRGAGGRGPTVREIAEHARLLSSADLAFPILLCSNRRVMDGMHRIARCFLEGRSHISAKVFPRTPAPDFDPADPAMLSYDPADFALS